MTYYKVCMNLGNSNFSAVQFDCNLKIEYKLGEFVYPDKPGYPLFIFNNLKSAKDFIESRYGDCKIYECEVEGLYESVPEVFSKQKWPSGTRFAYGVKLTKKVEEEKVVEEEYVTGDIIEVTWPSLGIIKYIIIRFNDKYQLIRIDNIYECMTSDTFTKCELNNTGIKNKCPAIVSVKKIGHIDKISYDKTL